MAHRSESAPLGAATTIFSFHEIARAVSLGLSVAILLFVLLAPQAVKREDALLTTAVMPIMLLGVVGGLVHALGYRPRSPTLAAIFGPWAAWPLMISSLVFLIAGAN